MTGNATPDRAAMNQRAILIAELLRMGYPIHSVVKALKHTNAGDLHGAIKVLTKLERS